MKELEKLVQKDFYNATNELKKCKNKQRYHYLLNILDYLSQLKYYKNLEFEVPKELKYELDKVNVEKYNKQLYAKLLTNIYQNYDYNIKIASLSSIFQRYYDLRKYVLFDKKISFDESLNVTEDFFKEYDKDIYDYFMFLKDNHRINTFDYYVDMAGLTIPASFVNDSYILVREQDIIGDILTIAHETIHAYLFDKTKYNDIKQYENMWSNNFEEVYPLFIEKVMMDYLYKHDFNASDILKLKQVYDTDMLTHLGEYKEFLNMQELEYIDYAEKESYSYSHVISYHFYDHYLNDPTKTKKDILQFMLDTLNKNREYLLNNYGLSQDKLTNPYYLIKHLDNHLIRR